MLPRPSVPLPPLVRNLILVLGFFSFSRRVYAQAPSGLTPDGLGDLSYECGGYIGASALELRDLPKWTTLQFFFNDDCCWQKTSRFRIFTSTTTTSTSVSTTNATDPSVSRRELGSEAEPEAENSVLDWVSIQDGGDADHEQSGVGGGPAASGRRTQEGRRSLEERTGAQAATAEKRSEKIQGQPDEGTKPTAPDAVIPPASAELTMLKKCEKPPSVAMHPREKEMREAGELFPDSNAPCADKDPSSPTTDQDLSDSGVASRALQAGTVAPGISNSPHLISSTREPHMRDCRWRCHRENLCNSITYDPHSGACVLYKVRNAGFLNNQCRCTRASTESPVWWLQFSEYLGIDAYSWRTARKIASPTPNAPPECRPHACGVRELDPSKKWRFRVKPFCDTAGSLTPDWSPMSAILKSMNHNPRNASTEGKTGALEKPTTSVLGDVKLWMRSEMGLAPNILQIAQGIAKISHVTLPSGVVQKV